MVPSDKILKTARETKRRSDRPERTDHAFARGNGARGEGNGARRIHRSAADRRRHHQPHAHGRENRARVPPAGRARAGCFARRGRGGESGQRGLEEAISRRRTARNRNARGRNICRGRRSRCCRLRRRAARSLFTIGPRTTPPRPSFLGTRVYNPVPLEEIVPYIDWTPFFHAWELRGIYPKIFEQEGVGPKAKELFDDGQKLLDRIVREKLLEARAVIGFFPANSVQEDIEVYADESRHLLTTFHTLRQQLVKDNQGTQLRRGGFRRAARERAHGLSGRVRRHRGTAHRTAGRKIRKRPRRLQRPDGQGAGRPPGRRPRGIDAQARAHRMGLRQG